MEILQFNVLAEKIFINYTNIYKVKNNNLTTWVRC